MSQTPNFDPNELDEYVPSADDSGAVREADEADVYEQSIETPLTERRGGVNDELEYPEYNPDDD